MEEAERWLEKARKDIITAKVPKEFEKLKKEVSIVSEALREGVEI